jgi:hypothetical protein
VHQGLPIWPFVLMGILAVLAWIINRMQQQKRSKAWMPFAASLDCGFDPEDPFDIPRISPQSLFSQGHSRRASNVMFGTYQGREVRCFDYRYTIGSGDDSRTYSMTCLLIEAPISFPVLSLRPEGFLDHLGHALGIEDINFESDEFNRRFAVKCEDRKFAYGVIHQGAMDYLLLHRPLCIEGNGMTVLFHYNQEKMGRLPLPSGVRALLDISCGFMDLLPGYLTGQRSSRPAGKEPSPPAPN